MEIGEATSPSISMEQHDEECYFCREKATPAEMENIVEDDTAEDDDLDGLESSGIKFKNDAGKLGKACGGPPGYRSIVLHSKVFDTGTAAHHLIPGNAALKKSDLFKSKKWLWKKGMVKGNIGYNINSTPNGVWLPGNYAQRPWGTNGLEFNAAENREPKDYAFAAIDVWGAQFHDAHVDYSNFVIDVLDKIHSKLKTKQSIWCPEAKKRQDEKPEKRTPLYVLVNRLHSVSGRMQRMLVFPTSNWMKNIFTSRFSKLYMKEKPHKDLPGS